MRAIYISLVVGIVASAGAALADDFVSAQPAVISYYGQPVLVAAYPPVYWPQAFYHNWPVVMYPVTLAGGPTPAVADTYLAASWPAIYPKQDIYYTAPPTPPGMADTPLGVTAEGKQSTMLR